MWCNVHSMQYHNKQKMLQLVVVKLMRHPLDTVFFPNEEKMAYFASIIQEREPVVDDVIGFMDGLAHI